MGGVRDGTRWMIVRGPERETDTVAVGGKLCLVEKVGEANSEGDPTKWCEARRGNTTRNTKRSDGEQQKTILQDRVPEVPWEEEGIEALETLEDRMHRTHYRKTLRDSNHNRILVEEVEEIRHRPS